MTSHYLQSHILEIVPTFCWVSAYDILLMVENKYPEVDESVLRTTVCSMAKRGLLEAKPTKGKSRVGLGRVPQLYKRPENHH